MSLDQVIEKRKILVTCGTGGVGKTTLSAAIAMRAALAGKRTVVITIDPAKRLATSLGFETLGNEPTDLTDNLRTAISKAKINKELRGSFSAVIPDSRKTFEAFIESLKLSKDRSDRVLNNPIIKIFAREFSGANEYLALQKLYELHQDPRYDFIVLDTPPSRNTRAFLESPKLLAKLFEEKIIRWLVLPANQLVASGMKKALGILEKLTGAGFMTQLFEFGSALFDIQNEFLATLKKTSQLLQSPQVGFMVVSSPTPETIPELDHFLGSIREHGFHFDGVALNRSLSYLNVDEDPSLQAHSDGKELLKALRSRELEAIRELRHFTKKHSFSSDVFLAQLPELARDVHSIEDLFHVAMAFDSGQL